MSHETTPPLLARTATVASDPPVQRRSAAASAAMMASQADASCQPVNGAAARAMSAGNRKRDAASPSQRAAGPATGVVNRQDGDEFRVSGPRSLGLGVKRLRYSATLSPTVEETIERGPGATA